MEFVLLIIILFVVWPLLRFYMMLRKAQRQARDAFSQFQGEGKDGSRQRKGGWSGGRQSRKKVIDRNVGEYVEFEEVEISRDSETKTGSDSRKESGYKVEQQVVDAEWEEIK